MKIRICYRDTGTGEDGTFDTAVPTLTKAHIEKALRKHWYAELHPDDIPDDAELEPDVQLKHFSVLQRSDSDRMAAFIAIWNDPAYFGLQFVTGEVYTTFA